MRETFFVRRLDVASLRQAGRVMGFWKASLLRCGEWFSRAARVLGIDYRHPVVRVKIRGYAEPLYLRLGTSDALVLQQIFVDREYSPFDTISPPPRTMVDGGANVGFSSFYFLHRYPDLRVIAVEPEPGNLKICQRNLAPFLDRVRLVRAGIWSRAAGLVFNETGWAAIVREAQANEIALTDGIDIPSLLKMIPEQEIDLLKVDIEKSEIVVFGSGSEAWLPRVRNISIELHDAQCEAVFDKALQPYKFTVSKCGELKFCRDIYPASEPDAKV